MSPPGIARRDEATADWYDALAQDRLLLRICPAGHFSRPDVLACDVCRSPDLTWAPCGGEGRVVAMAVDHGAGTTIAIVELSEGPWLVTRLDGEPAARGDRVSVRVVHASEGEAYPVVVRA